MQAMAASHTDYTSWKEISMKHLVLFVMTAVALSGVLTACQSKHETGVKSDLRSQWTNVNASTAATTDAAKAVLMDENLKDVNGTSTNVDGKVTGKMSDGTKVTVNISREPKATMSQVSVTVGTMGNPSLGANLAKKIKTRAEGGATTMP
jgi:hypothetical protein